jgi:phosphatidylserine decarboxylase
MNTYIHHAPEAIWVPLLIVVLAQLADSPSGVFLGIGLFALLFAFYRGATFPEHHQPLPPNVLISPCDGKLLRVVHHPTIHQTQIAIFLNIHNIHVQYVPISGTLTSIVHKPGEFHPAYLFEKSSLNERVETTLSTPVGNVRLVQIAGLLARRIVSFHSSHIPTYLHRGDPFGLIKFGSRVDIWLPTSAIQTFLTSTEPGTRIRIGDPLVQMQNESIHRI